MLRSCGVQKRMQDDVGCVAMVYIGVYRMMCVTKLWSEEACTGWSLSEEACTG